MLCSCFDIIFNAQLTLKMCSKKHKNVERDIVLDNTSIRKLIIIIKMLASFIKFSRINQTLGREDQSMKCAHTWQYKQSLEVVDAVIIIYTRHIHKVIVLNFCRFLKLII